MLDIYLKSGSSITVNNFTEVSFYSSGNLVTVTKDTIDRFFISPSITYKFKGTNTIVVNGDEIRFLELN
ncbi:hypothetical protein [Enterococcus faecium]|uniref:hypothetical protein n=1 Tax=Enterococcus faecium TaxID=1352 RepID=UPI000BF1AD89|nr:hypothetical protein [Enterococcus faecium]PEH49273.1 hypothetical protein CRM75_15965 [Enterococcus faecium]